MAKNGNKRFLYYEVRERKLEMIFRKPINKERSLSVIIIAKNEELKIIDCLKSVNWAGEIILVDNNSSDKTGEIAKKHGVKVYSFTKGSYSDWRNEGLKYASGDWVLYVDADERVTSKLRDEIQKLVSESFKKYSAFAIPRRNIILGKEMKYGGWWPDYVKRLFVRKKLRGWTGELHEEPEFYGELVHLQNPLLHIKHDNLSDMVEKTNIWSEVEAKLMFEANHPKMNVSRFVSAMFREFWLRMIVQKAFLDGSKGIIYAMYQVYSRFISYAKLWELQIDKRNANIQIRANDTNGY